jgi:hypothetical protein
MNTEPTPRFFRKLLSAAVAIGLLVAAVFPNLVQGKGHGSCSPQEAGPTAVVVPALAPK